jgi:hypothetical protein
MDGAQPLRRANSSELLFELRAGGELPPEVMNYLPDSTEDQNSEQSDEGLQAPTRKKKKINKQNSPESLGVGSSGAGSCQHWQQDECGSTSAR